MSIELTTLHASVTLDLLGKNVTLILMIASKQFVETVGKVVDFFFMLTTKRSFSLSYILSFLSFTTSWSRTCQLL